MMVVVIPYINIVWPYVSQLAVFNSTYDIMYINHVHCGTKIKKLLLIFGFIILCSL